MRDKIDLKYLPTDSISFEVKKFLVQSDKWDVPSTERIYVTKDGSTIVKLKLDDNISVGLYQAEDDYPNVKLNKRTSKYLLEYPELDKIPVRNLIKLVGKEAFTREVLRLCTTKKQMSYWETYYQMTLRVLEVESYNENIAGKWYRRDVNPITPELEAEEE